MLANLGHFFGENEGNYLTRIGKKLLEVFFEIKILNLNSPLKYEVTEKSYE